MVQVEVTRSWAAVNPCSAGAADDLSPHVSGEPRELPADLLRRAPSWAPRSEPCWARASRLLDNTVEADRSSVANAEVLSAMRQFLPSVE